MAIATANETSDATHAVIRSTPSITNSTSSGIAATSELHPREWATGSRTCLYTATTSRGVDFGATSLRFTPTSREQTHNRSNSDQIGLGGQNIWDQVARQAINYRSRTIARSTSSA